LQLGLNSLVYAFFSRITDSHNPCDLSKQIGFSHNLLGNSSLNRISSDKPDHSR